jgi:hypothetical protein
MLFVLFLILRIHENIIDEHHYKLVKIIHENTIHHVHKESWCCGPSASEGPQKHDLTMFLEYNT